jgi:hypothetical protein
MPDRRFPLDRNPLKGAARAPQKNPVHPITTWDRFVAMRAAMQRRAAKEEPGSSPPSR